MFGPKRSHTDLRSERLAKLLTEEQYGRAPETQQDYITYESQRYPVLNHKITDFQQPLISAGSIPDKREFLLFDPQSEAMQEQLFLFKQSTVHCDLTIEQQLKTAIDFVNSVFPTKTLIELNNETDLLLDAARQNNKTILTTGKIPIPVISFDTFILNRLGCCRHTALLVAFLVDSLIKQKLLNCISVQVFRETRTVDRQKINHACNIVQCSTGNFYLLDAARNLVFLFTQSTPRTEISKLYGGDEHFVNAILNTLFPPPPDLDPDDLPATLPYENDEMQLDSATPPIGEPSVDIVPPSNESPIHRCNAMPDLLSPSP